MKEFFKWLKNSTKIKRWIFLIILGMILTCYGFAQPFTTEDLTIMELLKIVVIFALGFTMFVIGIVFMQRRTMETAINIGEQKDENESRFGITDIKEKGPKIVVLGGGTGLHSILQGLKLYTNNITAIVPVSNYGKGNDVRPTEDIKNSLIALAKNTDQTKAIMNTLISKKPNVSFADLYLDVATSVYGDFVKSIENSNNILSMVGKVLPVTQDEMRICAELENGMVVEEKSKLAEIVQDKVTKIHKVYINPSNCKTAPGVLQAIKEADAIIIGPGSLYTNVIPNLLIKNVAKEIRESKAFKIYVANIMTQPGETDDYDVSDHIDAIIEHAGNNIVNYCICDNGVIVPEILRKYNYNGSSLVNIDTPKLKGKGFYVIKDDISCVQNQYIRHNPEKLAKVIMELIFNELKYKDKRTDRQYLLLKSKLKEEKIKEKIIKQNEKNKKKKEPKQKQELKNRKTSKFANKYKDRIQSIQESEETRKINIEIYKKTQALIEKEEQLEKEKYINNQYKQEKKTKQNTAKKRTTQKKK